MLMRIVESEMDPRVRDVGVREGAPSPSLSLGGNLRRERPSCHPNSESLSLSQLENIPLNISAVVIGGMRVAGRALQVARIAAIVCIVLMQSNFLQIIGELPRNRAC